MPGKSTENVVVEHVESSLSFAISVALHLANTYSAMTVGPSPSIASLIEVQRFYMFVDAHLYSLVLTAATLILYSTAKYLCSVVMLSVVTCCLVLCPVSINRYPCVLCLHDPCVALCCVAVLPVIPRPASISTTLSRLL
jgi:NhaP-type Na+/H+ and K+/H+ antiporter